MCQMLKRTLIPIAQILMPLFSVTAFWLGMSFISPASPLPWLILCIGLELFAMALPVLIIRYWPSIEEILLLGDALISHQAYGSQRLTLRANLKALVIGLIFAVVVRALGFGQSVFCCLVLPLAVVVVAISLIVLGCLLFSFVLLRRYDGLITVCRYAGSDPVTGQVLISYEGWTFAEIRRQFHVGNDGYALTMEEEYIRFMSQYR